MSTADERREERRTQLAPKDLHESLKFEAGKLRVSQEYLEKLIDKRVAAALKEL